jgi:hypothetical protein
MARRHRRPRLAVSILARPKGVEYLANSWDAAPETRGGSRRDLSIGAVSYLPDPETNDTLRGLVAHR